MQLKNSNIFSQSELLLVALFLRDFSVLEKNIFRVYNNKIKMENNGIISYYCGGLSILKKVYLDVPEYSFNINKMPYSKIQGNFSEVFSLKQILKIDKNKKIISDFHSLEIESVQQNLIYYNFFDVCEKLISMRNKVAHEYSDRDFNSAKDVIEVLNISNITKYFNNEYEIDLTNLSDISIQIISNLCYLNILNTRIKKLISN